MTPSSRVTRRKVNFYKWPELENDAASKPREQRLIWWLTPHRGSKAPPLCHRCRSRKLDLRPLTAKPPKFSELPEDPETEDLDELETRYAVNINDFSPEKAKATSLECSLCALLLACLDETEQDGWLGNMSCVCTLRPRFDRSTNSKKGAKLIHKEQVWVEFQPIEGEVLIDMVDVKGCNPTGKRRTPVSSTANIELLRHWLKDCDVKYCRPDIPGPVRSRMNGLLSDGIFRVIDTSTGLVKVLTSLPKFAALSYVWGRDSGQSSVRPLEGGPISDYPSTIRDSIATARSLGYEWLWVDRVCIDQTSENEKAKLIPYMRDIYTAAHLTIVAACGENAESGLLGSSGTPRPAEKPLILGPTVAVLPKSKRFENLLDRAFWDERGWTFQEHVFSRRLLFVFKSEMFFNCGGYKFRESTGRRPVIENEGPVDRWLFSEGGVSDAASLQAIFHGKAARPEKLLTASQFLGAVMDYSERNLTVEEDRLPAFAGVILAAMNPLDRASEQAILQHGHPLRFFESLLTWRDSHSILDPVPITSPYVPSWSWAFTGRGVYIRTMGETGGYDQYCWFHYSQLWNYDILGLPTKNNAMAQLTELPLPDELIADRSWIKNLPQRLNSSYQGEEATTATAFTFLSPPNLHLLTLVFDARLVKCNSIYTDRYVLIAVGTTESVEDVKIRARLRLDVMETWCIRPDRQNLFPSEGVSSRQESFETFAIITGHPHVGTYVGTQWINEVCYDLNIMLLEPTGQKDTYSRLGINRLINVWKDEYTAETIRRGRPRGQYIHIV